MAYSIFYGLNWPLLFFVKSGDSSQLLRESLLPSSFYHMGQCSNNANHHTFVYLQLKDYNSLARTMYDSISNMEVMVRAIKNGTMVLHGNISLNGYENAIIGRYGGCFEENIWCLF